MKARRLAVAAAATAVLAAACTGGGGPGGHPSATPTEAVAVPGGTATFALPPATTPDYIFPLMGVSHFSVANMAQFQYLFYRPLYFFGVGERPTINYASSLAYPPVFGDGGRSVTVTLKDYYWSDGTPVTARDVAFWQNLVSANKAHWAAYLPGQYPDNVVSTTILSPKVIRFNLNRAYGKTWFTYNELSQITPLPQHVMDVVRSGGAVGNYDRTRAGALAVYRYLSGLAGDLSSYPGGSRPSHIWSVIDGPWKLASYSRTAPIVFVPNPGYRGPDRPSLARFEERPFPSAAAEFAALRAGALSYGYVPLEDVARSAGLRSRYRFVPWVDFAIGYFVENLNNPRVGAILRQTYIRQVLEELVDQRQILRSDYLGYGGRTCGPVPLNPANPFADAYERSCPHGYDPARAVRTLEAHGWHVVPGGVSTCARPGSGPGRCGPGVAGGARLEFSYLYATGSPALAGAVRTLRADAERAGVRYDLTGQSFAQVVATAVPCRATDRSCGWQIANWGGSWVFSPDYYPTGEALFATGAGSNSANYADRTNDRNVRATMLPGDAQANLNRYQDYLTDQVPFIWSPDPAYALSAISNRLAGAVPQNVYLNLLPEQWQLTR